MPRGFGRYFLRRPVREKSYKSAKHSGGIKWGKTSDPKVIKKDFSKWPHANVAVVTGKHPASSSSKLIPNEGHGVDGLASIKALETKHGALPSTLMAESPSGSSA